MFPFAPNDSGSPVDDDVHEVPGSELGLENGADEGPGDVVDEDILSHVCVCYHISAFAITCMDAEAMR